MLIIITAKQTKFNEKLNDISISSAVHFSSYIQQLIINILLCNFQLTTNPYYRGRSDEPFLALSDTGHHRVLLTDCSGVVLKVIGGPDPGFKDGSKLSCDPLLFINVNSQNLVKKHTFAN